MKKLFILITILIVGCRSNPDAKLELKIITLEKTIDSLENVITTSFSPIVINNNYQPHFGAGDSISFVVGMALNKSELIDSVNINVKNTKTGEIPTNDYSVRRWISNGLTYVTLSNLNIGKYVYEGNLYFRSEEFPIEYEFEIGDK